MGVGGWFSTAQAEPESLTVDIEKESPDITPDVNEILPVPATPTTTLSPSVQSLSTMTPRAATVSANAERKGGLTADDLRGLSPSEVDAVVRRQIAIDSQTQEMEELLGTTAGRLETSRLKQAEMSAAKANAIFKAKEAAAKAIAESDLPPEEQNKRITALSSATDLQSVYDLSVGAFALPKRENVGTDREALSAELFDKRYGQLTTDQRAQVNRELLARTQPATEVVTNEAGVFVVDKRTGTARLVTIGPNSSNTAQAGTVYKSVSPITSRVEARQQGTYVLEQLDEGSISRLATDIKNSPLSREQLVDIYSGTILRNSTPLAQRTFHAALTQAYPDLADSLPKPTMSDTAPVFPEAVTGTGPTAQLKVGDPLPGTPKKQPTKEQSEAFGFGSSALAANNVITRLETRGIYGRMGSVAQTLEWLSKVDPAPAVAAGSGAGAVIGIMVPVIGGPGGGSVVGGAFGAGIMGLTMLLAEPLANMARTPEEQQYFQAKSDFIGAVLRKESGAAISNSEYRREEQRFFPQLDDKPPVIKQKAEARARKIREFEVQSGRKLMP